MSISYILDNLSLNKTVLVMNTEYANKHIRKDYTSQLSTKHSFIIASEQLYTII